MSKSYKHTPRCGDKKSQSSKKQANRRVRYAKELYQYSNYKKLYCSWEICDYEEVGITFQQFYNQRKRRANQPWYTMNYRRDWLDIKQAKKDYFKWYLRK